jgi:hypothetical protein
VFGQEGEFSLGFGRMPKVARFRVYCSDLTERKLLNLVDKRFASRNPLNLIFGDTYWFATPVLSDPVRRYELTELKDLVFKEMRGSLRLLGVRSQAYRAALGSATTFDQVYTLLQRPTEYPGLDTEEPAEGAT